MSSSDIVIATHNGAFHCDDVSAVAMLYETFPNKVVNTIRTRDPAIIATADIVVDVGGVYDPEKDRFDHHQRGCNELWDQKNDDSIPLSSIGMVYKKYGRQYIQTVLNVNDKELVEDIFLGFYGGYVREVDALDNGVQQHEKTGRYPIYTNVTNLVSKSNHFTDQYGPEQENAFHRMREHIAQTMRLVLESVMVKTKALKEDLNTVREVYTAQKDNAPNGPDSGLLGFPRAMPCLFQALGIVEKEENLNKWTKMVYYPSGDQFNVRNISDNGFQGRAYVPKNIRELVKYPDEIKFVHNNLFLVACTTERTAREIGEITISLLHPKINSPTSVVDTNVAEHTVSGC